MTPEEKLLKIIEAGTPHVQKDGSIATEKKPSLKVPLAMKTISIQTVNQWTVGICIVVTLIYIVLWVKTNNNLRKRFEQITRESDKIVVNDDEELAPSKPTVSLSDIFSRIREHNIFSLEQIPRTQERSAMDYTHLMSRLKLVGIIWSDQPQAMIEDSETSKTYLVGKGAAIGSSKVKDIFRDKVVISDGSNEWEIQ